MTPDYTIRTFESGDYRVRMVYDPNPTNPRSEWDNGGAMWAQHPNYYLGDRNRKGDLTGYAAELDDFIREVEEFHSREGTVSAVLAHLRRYYRSTVVLPLYLYNHSGISISAGANLLEGAGINTRTHNPLDPGGWDTSFVGFAFNVGLPEHVKEWGLLDEEAIRAEVREYDAYLTGQVFGLVVERRVVRKTETLTPDGELLGSSEDNDAWDQVDACWNYFGYSYTESEARALLENYTKEA